MDRSVSSTPSKTKLVQRQDTQAEETDMRIIPVDAANVDTLGFFCYMSKKKSAGYQNKLKWVKERFKKGLRIQLLELLKGSAVPYR